MLESPQKVVYSTQNEDGEQLIYINAVWQNLPNISLDANAIKTSNGVEIISTLRRRVTDVSLNENSDHNNTSIYKHYKILRRTRHTGKIKIWKVTEKF